MTSQKIVWTKIDEAPALATYSLLPIVQAFTRAGGVEVETKDISLSGRILAQFPDRLTAEQRVDDNLTALGELAQTPEANIIKLPNISASVPQLKAAITELQDKGYDIPDYPETATTDADEDVQGRYAKVLGSAVNPVLREGNSDRRAPLSVKRFAQSHPHRLGAWSADNKAAVACMDEGDFYGNEKSVVMDHDAALRIELVSEQGTTVLKEDLAVTDGEIVDGTFMSARALRAFFAAQMEAAKAADLLLSVHLKATMMKVSDPVMFGHAVTTFFEPVFTKHADIFRELGVNPNLGLGDLTARLASLPADERAQIEADIQSVYAERPALAMVDSDKGITNLHAPNDIIIDASMPVVVRDSGTMWNAEGRQQQTLALVPDRSYARMYAQVFDDMRAHGALDPATMGDVPNVGLMAQKAEEYGSHPTTFVVESAGTVRVLDGQTVLMEHQVEAGDIWRMSRVKDVPVQDWVKLAVTRARATGAPAVFYLDKERAHDRHVIAKVEKYLPQHDTEGLTFEILPPAEAIQLCLDRIRKGEDTISVTGNVLRDYLTDLFPILELGTSAKMLSIVPLLNGGGLFETGAGGSAPKHVQQFVAEDYLRWDSLGEFSALGASLEHLASHYDNARAQVLADALDVAIGRFLEENRSPARKVGQIDNRGSHYYLASYWARALADQDQDAELKATFAPVAEQLEAKETQITEELIAVQGKPVDLGGYYKVDDELATAAMRPSATLNAVIDAL
ncbi:NADP-dependent isocitrate dehydrogenase [Arsenicicoccus dermatophilus]|uniref:NADP-dependent isocitrate dehydrogenase n=1 Tax=Arsenicicoccus dermatophilus TaxID=1076331 RepID=UPI00391735BF